MTKTEEALRAEVSGVCKNYCLQVWNEALNQARVKASSILRKAKSVYYPSAIRASGLANSRTDTTPEVVIVGKANPAKVLTSSNNPSEVAKHPGVIEKEVNANKEVTPDVAKTSTAT